MITLPLLRSLDVTDYGLYPGTESAPGLHIRFEPGLTFVLGANGLGKTTLVTMLYRMLTGPSDIPRLQGGANLGTANLRATALRPNERRTFAKRVADSGVHATARLVFESWRTETIAGAQPTRSYFALLRGGWFRADSR